MGSDELRERYSRLAPAYDEVVAEAGYTSYARMGELVLRHLEVPGASVLDLGCGTGLSSRRFLERGCSVTGIDIAPGMVARARRLSYDRLVCQDLEQPLDVPESSFDAAVCFGVTEFIRDTQVFFGRVARALKPGGVFGVTLPKLLPEDSKLDIRQFSRSEAEGLFARTGFVVLEFDEFFGYSKRDVGEDVFHLGFVVQKS